MNWLISRTANHVICLFQRMFEKTTLTFNPGWDGNALKLSPLHPLTGLLDPVQRLQCVRC